MAAEGVLLFGADGQLGHELQAELSVVGRLTPLTLALVLPYTRKKCLFSGPAV